jgi:hypothetical protein
MQKYCSSKELKQLIVNRRKLHLLARHCLKAAVASFVTRPGIPVFRWPVQEQLSSRSLFADCRDEEDVDLYDELVEEFPWGLPSRDLIGLAWDGILSSTWSLHAVKLDRQTWLYFEFNDYMDDCPYLLALAKTTSPQRTHQRFLQHRFRSNDFLPCPPTEITSGFSRSFLAECFTDAAEAAMKQKFTTTEEFWGEMCQAIAHHEPDSPVLSKAHEENVTARTLMDAYLAAVMTARSRL